MRLSPLIAALLALGAWNMAASSARADSHYESAIQYALEHLVSGIHTESAFFGTDVSVTPIRTWKSVSGHYCRQFDITVTRQGAMPEQDRGIRCRDSDGVWKKPRN